MILTFIYFQITLVSWQKNVCETDYAEHRKFKRRFEVRRGPVSTLYCLLICSAVIALSFSDWAYSAIIFPFLAVHYLDCWWVVVAVIGADVFAIVAIAVVTDVNVVVVVILVLKLLLLLWLFWFWSCCCCCGYFGFEVVAVVFVVAVVYVVKRISSVFFQVWCIFFLLKFFLTHYSLFLLSGFVSLVPGCVFPWSIFISSIMRLCLIHRS